MDHLIQTVARHRVAPQVHRALTEAGVRLPPGTAARLAQMAGQAARRSLNLARESLFLQSTFDRAGLDATFVKGSALALLMHRDVGMKDSWDIDLLVRPDQVEAACDLLIAEGYLLDYPKGLSPDAFRRFQDVAKECVFFHPARNIYLELHWKLVDNPHELSGLDLRQTQSVALGSGKLRTLADPELFAYLCVHGTRHSWSRLKWIADVAAFLKGRSSDEITRLRDQAVAMGAGRAPDVALTLCQSLFGHPLATTQLDPAGRYLVHAAHASLTHGGGVTEIAAYSKPWRMTWIGRHLIGTTPRAFLAELESNWAGDYDRVHMPLPRGLGFLYVVIRIPLWLWRKARRLWPRGAHEAA
ncbi:nucleotidyltransferase family protein [Brevundimonas sp.]|uniref:nucleotidyltransferase domain-containing protein n=1 Tax=Brevundimonas sp. TaxID=1871086 RepID=UPI003515A8DD